MFRNHIIEYQEHQYTRTLSERTECLNRNNIFLLYYIFPTVAFLNFTSTLRIHYTSHCGEITCVGIGNVFRKTYRCLISKNVSLNILKNYIKNLFR